MVNRVSLDNTRVTHDLVLHNALPTTRCTRLEVRDGGRGSYVPDIPAHLGRVPAPDLAVRGERLQRDEKGYAVLREQVCGARSMSLLFTSF